jgi:hypothetical protein
MKIKESKQFKVEGTFESMYAAHHWLKENGYGYGSTSAMHPTAVMKGDYYSYNLPHKMKNFTAKEKKQVHGIITGEMREGPVFVHIYDNH